MAARDPAAVWAQSPDEAKAVENAVRWHVFEDRDVNVLGKRGGTQIRICRVLKKAGGWLVVPGYRQGLGRLVSAGVAAELAGAEVNHAFGQL